MIRKIINHKSKNVTRAALILSIATFLSHILGLVRDRLLAGTFGAGPELDIYFAAFRIPTLLQSVIVTGGVGTVLLPLFSEEMEKGKEKALKFLSNVLNLSVVALFVVCVVLFIFTPFVSRFVSPGFTVRQQEQLVLLTRAMYLSPILLGASMIFSNFLQYYDRFLVYGLGSIFYNTGIILGIIFFYPSFGLVGLAYGVVFGALLHLLSQALPSLISGFSYSRVFKIGDDLVKRMLRLMGPTALTALFVQLGLVVTVALASGLFPGSISIINLITRIKNVPVGLLGTSFAIASFPVLSKRWVRDRSRFWDKLYSVISQASFLIIPVSLFTYVLRAQIVRVVFQTGSWGWEDTRLAAATLGAFSFFMFFEALVVILRRAMYSIQRVRWVTAAEAVRFVVMSLSILGLIFLFNNSLSFRLFASRTLRVKNVGKVSILAFPLGIGFSSLIQAVLLFVFLKREGMKKEKAMFASLLRIVSISVISALFSWLILRPMAIFLQMDRVVNLLFQMTVSFAGGALLYLLLSYIFSFPEIDILKNEREGSS